MDDNVRKLFQVIALGNFVFQMFNSINKYIEKPIVQQSSATKLEQIQVPDVYICQVNK